jgi:hypothetical protein
MEGVALSAAAAAAAAEEEGWGGLEAGLPWLLLLPAKIRSNVDIEKLGGHDGAGSRAGGEEKGAQL